jgi:hypothetical protein
MQMAPLIANGVNKSDGNILLTSDFRFSLTSLSWPGFVPAIHVFLAVS